MKIKGTPAQLETLRDIVADWVAEGHTTPPYEAAVYDIFEALNLDPTRRRDYDIRRPEATP